MNNTRSIILLSLSLILPVQADERITEAMVLQVIDTTDAAAMNRDTAGISEYLGDEFEKVIEFVYKKWMAKVRLDKQQYLQLIEEGWTDIAAYSYQRDDTEIHVTADGLSAESYSTVTENMVRDSQQMTSRVREYATYEQENGKLVITEISGYTLVGDTTPQYQAAPETTVPGATAPALDP